MRTVSDLCCPPNCAKTLSRHRSVGTKPGQTNHYLVQMITGWCLEQHPSPSYIIVAFACSCLKQTSDLWYPQGLWNSAALEASVSRTGTLRKQQNHSKTQYFLTGRSWKASQPFFQPRSPYLHQEANKKCRQGVIRHKVQNDHSRSAAFATRSRKTCGIPLLTFQLQRWSWPQDARHRVQLWPPHRSLQTVLPSDCFSKLSFASASKRQSAGFCPMILISSISRNLATQLLDN